MSRYVRVSMPYCVLKVPLDFNLDDLKGNMVSGFYANGERVDHLQPGRDYDFTPLPVVPEWYVETLAEEYFERHVVFDPSPPTWTGVVEHARQYVADMRVEQKDWFIDLLWTKYQAKLQLWVEDLNSRSCPAGALASGP
jgi:hypothetical protein